jgi:hypothetical protein
MAISLDEDEAARLAAFVRESQPPPQERCNASRLRRWGRFFESNPAR